MFMNKSSSFHRKVVLFLVLLFSFNVKSFSQERHWGELIVDPKVKFDEIKNSFDQEWKDKEYEKGKGFKQFHRWANFWENRLLPNGNFPLFSKAFNEYSYFQSSFSNFSETNNEQWTALGPFDYQYSQSWSPGQGRVNCIEQDPNNTQIIYLGTPSGGLWKSSDGGINWQPKSDFLSVIGISSIAINPSNSQEIYIATGDADGGDTYSIGIWKSIDGGDNWSQTSFPSVQANKLQIDPFDNNLLWAASNLGLYKSVNGGLEWELIYSGNIRDFSLSPNNSDIFYFSTSNNVYYSLDQGQTISQSLGLLSEKSRISITVSDAEPNSVYILTAAPNQSFAGVYKSIDNAQNFTLQNGVTDIFDGSTQAYYDMAIVVSDQDPNFLVAGVLNLWKSSNGGVDWTPVNSWNNPSQSAYTHADIHFLKYFDNTLYCGSDGGIYKSTDDAISFTDLSQKLQIGQFYKISSNQINPFIVSGGLQDNGGFYFNGQEWIVWHGADGMESVINPYNSSEVYGMSQFGNLYSSTDGESINYLGSPENGRWVTPMQYDSINNKIIAGFSQLYSYSVVAGWQQLSNYEFPSLIAQIEIYQNNSDTIFLSEGSNFYKSEDGGLTITQLNSPSTTTITSIEVNNNNPNEIWVVQGGWIEGQKVFHSIDMGQSWQNISNNLPNLPSNVIKRHHSTNDLYLGMDIGVYHFNNETSLWTSFNGNLPNVIVNDIEISESFDLVTIGTYGRGVWHSNTYNAELDSIRLFAYQIDSIDDFLCSNSVVPFVSYINVGYNDINNISVNYYIDGTPYSYLWEGNVSSGQTLSFELPEIQNLVGGSHNITVEVIEVNGQEYNSPSENLEFNFYSSLGQEDVNFNLSTDCYASETTFSLFDEDNNLIYFQGNSLNNYSQNQYSWCLQPACYTLFVYDSYGDGMAGTEFSCDSDGNFFLFNQNNDIILEMGDANFGSEISFDFCIEATVLGCVDTNANNYNIQANTSDESCTYNSYQFCDDFEDYNDGDFIAENSENWETWATSNNNLFTPPYIDDAQVVTGTSVSGSNALFFPYSINGGPQDIILPFTEQHTVSDGYLEVSFNILVSSENGAYFNFQQNHTPGSWILNSHVEQNQILFSDANNTVYFQTAFNESVWNNLKFKFDLIGGNLEFLINDEIVFSEFVDIYEVGSINLYPLQNHQFWVDDICYIVDSNPFGCTDTNALNYDIGAYLTDNSLCCYSANTDDVQTHCDEYTWIDGIIYTESNNTASLNLTNSQGCDSIVTLDLTIINSTSGMDMQTHCDEYTWIDGNTYTESNVDATWTVPNANGCDSIITLNLTINSSTTVNESQLACDSYTWIDGITYTETGDYTYIGTNDVGCPETIILTLVINESNEIVDEQVHCNEYTWIDGITYTESNNSAIFTLTNSNGCDSILTLDLTINQPDTSFTEVTACDSYDWNGQTYTESGEYTNTHTNVDGCDSTHTLNLTINSTTFGTDTQVHCGEYTWIDGITYTESNNTATFTLSNNNNCDSVVTLDLVILNSTTGVDIQEHCDTYTWIDEVTYTSSNNTVTHTLTNAAGCDSVVTLDLIINNSDNTSSSVTACDEFTWDSQTYTESGEYTNTYTNINGCDSTHTLNLTINNSSSSNSEVSSCVSYEWNGLVYENSGTYQFDTIALNGCDSTAILELEICLEPLNIFGSNTAVTNTSSSYSVQNNPASMFNWTLNNGLGFISSGQFTNEIVVDWSIFEGIETICVVENYDCSGVECVGDTVCFEVEIKSPSGVIENKLNINIFPNPSFNLFKIEFNSNSNTEISVTNVLGEIVYFDSAKPMGKFITQIDLSNYSKGVYNLSIKNSDGISNHKLILQ